MPDRLGVWLLIVAAGAVTLLFRASFIVFANPERFPDWFRRGLAYVPPAVIAALIVPGLMLPPGAREMSATQPRLAAGLVALLIAWRTRNMLLTIVSGMAVLWALQWSGWLR